MSHDITVTLDLVKRAQGGDHSSKDRLIEPPRWSGTKSVWRCTRHFRTFDAIRR